MAFVGLLMVAVGCRGPVVPADSGVRYHIFNECTTEVTVSMKSGSDRVRVAPGGSASFRSLDETADEVFVAVSPAGSVVEVDVGLADIRLEDDLCQQP